MTDFSSRIANLSPEKRAILARYVQKTASQPAGAEPLAIIGLGCRLPGGVDSPESFWQLLANGVDAISEVPQGRWPADAYYDPDPAVPGKMATRWGGFVEDIERFDTDFFGIVPREAERMDPQQRLLLETTWDALERAGRPAESLAGSRVGVFVGIHSMSSDYYWSQARNRRGIDAYTSTGAAHSIAANRISYLLDLRGPSLAVDTACSSSLVAVHLACQSLRTGECDMALAGGVNLILSPEASIAFSKLRMMAADGRCKTFDARADGFVRGEGCGIVVLRRLDQAIKEGDPILAVIRGSAVNQDGATNGLTAPNGLSQQEVVRQALRDASVEPEGITFVETHGTGTALGDPIEVESLAEVLGRASAGALPCMLGAVKTNLGHLEAAAGIASLIKVALCLQHKYIPANLHFRGLNPHISLDGSRLVLAGDGSAWLPGSSSPRRAGVSSFGFGGTNAHVILEEFAGSDYPKETDVTPDGAGLWILPLSARTPDALRAHEERVAQHLKQSTPPSVRDIAFTAGVRRTHHEFRRAVVGGSHTEWLSALEQAPNGERAPAQRGAILRPWPGLVFVYSGQGPQWAGMGKELYRTHPAFRAALDRCDAEFRRHASWSILEELARPDATSRLQETAIAQPAIFAIQYALTESLHGWGITPDAVVGHSAGEVTAAWAAGALRFDEAARLVVNRGDLMERTAGQGAMAAVELPLEEARAAIAGFENRIDVGAVNSPTSTVLSGEIESVEAVVEALRQRGVFAKRLGVNFAFHSRQMETLQPELIQRLSDLTPMAPRVAIASTVTGRLAEGAGHDARYWARNMREPVRFADAIRALSGVGHRVFLELSPHPILTSMITRCGDQDLIATGSLRKGADELRTLLKAVATLYEVGLPVDFQHFHAGRARTIQLPTYPWQRSRHWFSATPQSALPEATGPTYPLLGRRLPAALPIFENELSLSELPLLGDHRVFGRALMPAAAYLEIARMAGTLTLGHQSPAIRELAIERALVVPEDRPRRLQTVVAHAQNGDAEIQIFSAGEEADAAWTRHAVARVASSPPQPSAPGSFKLEDVCARCRPVALADHYQQLQDRGLSIGPSFRLLERLLQGDREAVARIAPPRASNDASSFPNSAWLDACLQPLLAAVGGVTYLLSGVGRLVTWGEPVAAWSHAVVASDAADRRTLTGVVRAYADDGSLRLEAEGVVLKMVEDLTADVQKHAPAAPARYEIQWRRQNEITGTESAIPDASRSDALAPTAAFVAGLRAQHQLDAYDRLVPELESLSVAFVLRAFEELGWVPAPGDHVSVDGLIDSLGIVPAHRRLFARLCGMLQEEGILEPVNGGWQIARTPPSPLNARERCRELRRLYPMCDAELSLFERCGAELGAVLGGQRDALQLLFPEGSFEAVERLYRDAPFSRVDNTLLQHTLARALASRPEGQPVRILEVGAGTGGSTTYVLPALAGAPTEYVFTDVSQIFLTRARQKFRGTPGLRFELLDIERNPDEQGFAGRQFDFVIAANVIHATSDLRQTLRHVRQLMAPGGRLLLLEVTRPQRWIDLTFGLTDGWWRFADHDLRPARALLTASEWLSLLAREGFESPSAIAAANGSPSQESVIAAQVAGGPGRRTGRWLVVADRSGVGDALAQRLRARGEEAILVTEPPAALDALANGGPTGAPWRGVVYLRGLDGHVEDASSIDDVVTREAQLATEVVRCSAIAADVEGAHLWLVTRRAQPVEASAQPGDVEVAASTLWGLGRGIALEHPEVWGGLIDVDGDSATIVDRVCAEIGRDSGGEDQVAWRGADRYVPRLVHSEVTSRRPQMWRADGAYLITGGLGGVGLLVARALVRRGVRSLVLTTRTPFEVTGPTDPETDRRRAAVAELRALGATVTVAALDVADEAAMTSLVQQFGKSLPRLAGVFHAAASIQTASVRELDAASIRAMYNAKVGGGWLLHRLTRNLDVEDFVLFSSTTALIGATGFAHYAAANCFLDALAHYRRARNLPALSVNWGTWEAMRALSEAERAAVARGGLVPMAGEAAMALLDQARAVGRPQETIAAVDWAVLKPAYELRRRRPLLSELAVPVARPAERTAASAPNGAVDLRGQLEAVPPAARQDLLVEAVSRIVVAVMGYPPDRPIDVRQGFFDLGMDSLMAVDLRTRISALVERDLPAGVTFNHPTVEALAAYLAREIFRIDAEPAAIASDAAPAERAGEPADADTPRSIGDTLSLIDAELAAIDDLVRD